MSINGERFTITFSGKHDATVLELFPDDGVVDMSALFGVERPSLGVFLNEWNYGEQLCITVTDNVTGEAWTKPARPLADWEQLHAPEDA